MSFHTDNTTLPSSRVDRLRMWEDEKARKVAEDAAEAKRKRKRGTCSGPPRVKRKYTWKNGYCERKRRGQKVSDEEGGSHGAKRELRP